MRRWRRRRRRENIKIVVEEKKIEEGNVVKKIACFLRLF